MGGFTLRDMIINGWPVLSVLTVFSIISATIICDRFVAFKLAAMNARLFVANVIKILEEQGALTRAGLLRPVPQAHCGRCGGSSSSARRARGP